MLPGRNHQRPTNRAILWTLLAGLVVLAALLTAIVDITKPPAAIQADRPGIIQVERNVWKGLTSEDRKAIEAPLLGLVSYCSRRGNCAVMQRLFALEVALAGTAAAAVEVQRNVWKGLTSKDRKAIEAPLLGLVSYCSRRGNCAVMQRLFALEVAFAGTAVSVSQMKIGDVLVEQGNLPEALKAFNASLAIADQLAKADPGNAGWQRDLSVSQAKIGDVLVEQGNLPEALKAFNASLAIADRLAKADPGNAGWQRDLALAHGRVAAILARQGDRDHASAGFREGREIIVKLKAASPSNATLPKDLSWFEGQITALEKR